MYADTIKATREGSLYFDERTILAVEQRGGGGAGVAGNAGVVGGLRAENLITGESTETVITEKNELITEQAGTIAMQAETIETQAGTIATQQETIEEQAETIANLENQLENSYIMTSFGLEIRNNTNNNFILGGSQSLEPSPSFAGYMLQAITANANETVRITSKAFFRKRNQLKCYFNCVNNTPLPAITIANANNCSASFSGIYGLLIELNSEDVSSFHLTIELN